MDHLKIAKDAAFVVQSSMAQHVESDYLSPRMSDLEENRLLRLAQTHALLAIAEASWHSTKTA